MSRNGTDGKPGGPASEPVANGPRKDRLGLAPGEPTSPAAGTCWRRCSRAKACAAARCSCYHALGRRGAGRRQQHRQAPGGRERALTTTARCPQSLQPEPCGHQGARGHQAVLKAELPWGVWAQAWLQRPGPGGARRYSTSPRSWAIRPRCTALPGPDGRLLRAMAVHRYCQCCGRPAQAFGRCRKPRTPSPAALLNCAPPSHCATRRRWTRRCNAAPAMRPSPRRVGLRHAVRPPAHGAGQPCTTVPDLGSCSLPKANQWSDG